MLIERPKETIDFTPTPAGQHTAICCRVVDYGTHISTGMYAGKKQRKLMIAWELPDHKITFQDKDGKEVSGPVLHSERYTWSFHENANLRQTLEGWRGVPFRDPEDFEGPKAFDLKNLIGVPALIQITHTTKGDKTYANLQAIMKSPYKREEWPSLETDPIYLNLREFDQGAFDRLSDYWQGLIKTTPEWAEIFGTSQGNGFDGHQSENPGSNLDDEDLPF